METKNCSKAKSGKCASPVNPQPLSNFRPQAGRPRGKSLCRSCEQRYAEEHRQEAILRSRAWNRANVKRRKEYLLRKLYSLSHNDWEALLARQNYSCAICLTHEAELKQGLAVDHCHKSNVVRGLLCHACNRALGLLREDFTRFERAMDYLLGIH